LRYALIAQSADERPREEHPMPNPSSVPYSAMITASHRITDRSCERVMPTARSS
jgi:hypothetical protein